MEHWTTGYDLAEVISEANSTNSSFLEWCNKWRLKVNGPKTKYMLHAPKHEADNSQVKMYLGNCEIERVDSFRCLGVILDDQLSFGAHVDQICAAALKAIHASSALFPQASAEMGLSIYSTKIRPHLERTYPVFCAGKRADVNKIERIHRIALLRATNTMSSTATSALEVITHTKPIRIRLKEILLQEHLRIKAMPYDNHLRQLICTLSEDEKHLDTKILSPIHIVNMAIKDLAPDVNFESVDKICPPSSERLNFTTPMVAKFMDNFGSANSRTTVQKELAKSHAVAQLNAIPSNELVIFTDGSALRNPGPCGASAVCYHEGMDTEPTVLTKSVSPLGTSYLGELCGLELATNHARENIPTYTPTSIHIFCDCQSAIQSISTTNIHSSHQDIIDNILRNITIIQKAGITVNLNWIAGHVKLQPNEIADENAKTAAESAKEMERSSSHTSANLIKQEIKQKSVEKWQNSWEKSDTGRWLFEFMPEVSEKRYHSNFPKPLETKLLRLLTGETRLKDNMYRFKFVDSPNCDCDRDRQTIEHVLLHCPLFSSAREKMINSIEMTYCMKKTPSSERQLTMSTLLAPNHKSHETRSCVLDASLDFIDELPINF